MNSLSQWGLRTAEQFYKLSSFPPEGVEDCVPAAYQKLKRERPRSWFSAWKISLTKKETVSPQEWGAARGHHVSPAAIVTAAQSSERSIPSSKVPPAKGLAFIPAPVLCLRTQVIVCKFFQISGLGFSCCCTSLFPLVLLSLKMPSLFQPLSRVRLCDPGTAAHLASLSITISQSFLKLMSIESMMLSNHLMFCRHLLLPSVIPSIRVFSNALALCIR